MVRNSSARMLLSVFALSCAGVFAMPLSSAEGPKPLPEAALKIRDVQLQENGTLELQLVDAQGKGLANVPVVVAFQNRKVGEAKTNVDGVVRMENLRGGQHVIQAGAGVEIVRLWEAAIAPPSAVRRLAIVSDEKVVRGQGNGTAQSFMGGGMNGLLGVGVVGSLVGLGYLLNENENQDDTNRSLQQQINALNQNNQGGPVSP